MKMLKHSAALLALTGALFSLTGCSDDDEGSDGSSSYPRTVNVEYKVTSKTGLDKANIHYKNETDGDVSLTDEKVPFSKKFTRTVKQFDALTVSVTAYDGGELTTEILVDDKVVDSKSNSGTDTVSGTAVHVFQ